MLLKPEKEEREKYTEEEYEDILNEIYGDVEICGISFESARALKELDPIAFDCGFADYQEYETVYICPICGEEWEDEDEAMYCCQEEEPEE